MRSDEGYALESVAFASPLEAHDVACLETINRRNMHRFVKILYVQ